MIEVNLAVSRQRRRGTLIDMTQDDYLGQDPAALSSAEGLDEDELRVDPLEKGMDPPERWSPAIEQASSDGETHEDRLDAEEPDVQPPR